MGVRVWSMVGVVFGLLGMLPMDVVAAETPIDIVADSLDVNQKSGKARFEGHVVATQGELTLHADTVNVAYGKGQSMQEIVATGHVRLKRGQTEQATGDTATYNMAGKTLVLTGSTVTLTRGPSTLEGDKVVYDMATGAAKVTRQGGPVKARFVPAGAHSGQAD